MNFVVFPTVFGVLVFPVPKLKRLIIIVSIYYFYPKSVYFHKKKIAFFLQNQFTHSTYGFYLRTYLSTYYSTDLFIINNNNKQKKKLFLPNIFLYAIKFNDNPRQQSCILYRISMGAKVHA